MYMFGKSSNVFGKLESENLHVITRVDVTVLAVVSDYLPLSLLHFIATYVCRTISPNFLVRA